MKNAPDIHGFVKKVIETFELGKSPNFPAVVKMGRGFGIENRREIKELMELAIVNLGRRIANRKTSLIERYRELVSLYQTHTNLSLRSSEVVRRQQYSTSIPIAFLAGVFVGIDKPPKGLGYFEPSAGNGLLTIAGKPEYFVVNEISEIRHRNLSTQGFNKVLNQDGAKPFPTLSQRFDGLVTNPPFEKMKHPAVVGKEYTVWHLDHLMSITALDTLKDSSRAAIIVGGHTEWDAKGRIKGAKNRGFLSYLYRYYKIVDIITIDGHALYSRMGTSFPIRLILIDGRKPRPYGYPPQKTQQQTEVINTFERLFERVMAAMKKLEVEKREAAAIAMKMQLALLDMQKPANALDGPYHPVADSCLTLDTMVPDAMDAEVKQAQKRIREELGLPFEDFVRDKLGYPTNTALCKALAGEQVDAVAMAIYNIEERGQGMIIADQTGTGKGRIAASVIRYAIMRGLKPIFFTESPNLFSDIYRDLHNIGIGHVNPFIVNARGKDTVIKDENGFPLFKPLPQDGQSTIFGLIGLPEEYDLSLTTYSQFSRAGSEGKIPRIAAQKINWLVRHTKENILIMDESHNASGSSQTGTFLQEIASASEGILFLSATWAKRPDNVPIYAAATALQDANLTTKKLVENIEKGGVALQEIISAQLVQEGQLLRREKSFDGIEINWINLDNSAKAYGLNDYSQTHRSMADSITMLMRKIIDWQEKYVDDAVGKMDDEASKMQEEVAKRGGTEKLGVDSTPYFSKVFNVVNQMLFSLKAEAVAELAITRLKEGKKPVIAFSSTLGSALESLGLNFGDTVPADFSIVLEKGLDGVRRITRKDGFGKKSFEDLSFGMMDQGAQGDFMDILELIRHTSSGLTLSPIDLITQRIEEAGYTVAEVTGRQKRIKLDLNTLKTRNIRGTLERRPKISRSDAFREFNNNVVDVLLINQSGSTGASAHAVPTDLVPISEVKQRVMIILQPELDINKEVQKRGRINRTGQLKAIPPIYDYVVSAVPAEQRLVMMLARKLKSLDANASGNQRNSEKMLSSVDFLNKYGSRVVQTYLIDNPEMNFALGNLLNQHKGYDPEVVKKNIKKPGEDFAHQVSGRVAILPIKKQEQFYDEITKVYNRYIDNLRQLGLYDLEVETLDLKAKTIETHVISTGRANTSVFGSDTFLEKVEMNNLTKPYTSLQRDQMVENELEDRTPEEIRDEILADYSIYADLHSQAEGQKINQRFEKKTKKAAEKVAILKKRLEAEEAKPPKPEEEIDENEESKADKLRKSVKKAEEDLKALPEEKDSALENFRVKFRKQSNRMKRWFEFFTVGRPVQYEGKHGNYDATFIGFTINPNEANRYAPSRVSARFVIASWQKYSAIPLSGDGAGILNASLLATESMTESDIRAVSSNWDTLAAKYASDRILGWIITGNIFQGMGVYKGRLISYTGEKGEVKKGFLVHRDAEVKTGKINVPIGRVAKVSLPGKITGWRNETFTLLRDFRDESLYQFTVSASKTKGGQFFLNERILDLIPLGEFQTFGTEMRAYIPETNIAALVQILDLEFKAGVEISPKVYTKILEYEKENPPPKKKRNRINFAETSNQEAEAIALAMQMQLSLLEIEKEKKNKSTKAA